MYFAPTRLWCLDDYVFELAVEGRRDLFIDCRAIASLVV